MVDSSPIPATSLLSHTTGSFLDEALRRDVSTPEALPLYRAGFRDGTLAAPWLVQPDMPVVRARTAGGMTAFAQRLSPQPGDARRRPFEIESLILPYTSGAGRRRQALCVASQVGCAMGCTFCETAGMGPVRQLEPDEIVAQWWAATFALGAQIDNIVFRGMGEPMDNLDAVLSAIEILTDPNGAAIPAARITVTTVGRTAGIRRLAAFARRPGFRRLGLAVALNAPNDDIRRAVMPSHGAESMAELKTALRAWTAPGRRVLVEYVLMPDANDATVHAQELADYLADLPCTVHVLPYEPRGDRVWPTPTDTQVARFREVLRAAGTHVQTLPTPGRDIAAPCGRTGGPEGRRRHRRHAPTLPAPDATPRTPVPGP